MKKMNPACLHPRRPELPEPECTQPWQNPEFTWQGIERLDTFQAADEEVVDNPVVAVA
jgi:hypothetical protein